MRISEKTIASINEAVSAQLMYWRNGRLDQNYIEKKLVEKSSACASIFSYRIHSGSVDIIDKVFCDSGFAYTEEMKVLVSRAHIYREMITSAILKYPIYRDICIAIDVGDMANDQRDLPIFTFQKRRDQASILLPDFEFSQYGFSRPSFARAIPYLEKKTMAVFAGSTTGAGHISMEVAREAAAPRLRAHRFFKRHTEVDFRLPAIVQTGGDEVDAYLRSQGLGEPPMNWDEAFRHKFIISIDGNGATCSRLAFAIDSTSVLLKYASDNILYWTDLLKPDVHYIPIYRDEQILDIVRHEYENRERYLMMTDSAREFADQFLARSTIEMYISVLLNNYGSIFR